MAEKGTFSRATEWIEQQKTKQTFKPGKAFEKLGYDGSQLGILLKKDGDAMAWEIHNPSKQYPGKWGLSNNEVTLTEGQYTIIIDASKRDEFGLYEARCTTGPEKTGTPYKIRPVKAPKKKG